MFDVKQYQKQYRLKNKEKYRPYHKEYMKKYRLKPEQREYDRKYAETYNKTESHKKSYEKHKPKHRKYSIERRLKDRTACIEHYSEGRNYCEICKIKDIDVLTIDHINGGGNQHRKKLKNPYLPNVLRMNNFPEGYRILCMNCQMKEARKNKLYGFKQ